MQQRSYAILLATAILLGQPAFADASALLNFDGVAEGIVLDEFYAQSHGVHCRGIGDGGPFPVIAKLPCTNPGSSPHVLSLKPVETCPETNDLDGWFEIDFDVEQSWVSIAVIHNSGGTASYLRVYGGPSESDFLDQRFGSVGAEMVGVAQQLRIERDSDETQIRRVQFGAFNRDASRAAFDDLEFPNIPVAISSWNWGALKSRF